jgi:hypothetical protein
MNNRLYRHFRSLGGASVIVLAMAATACVPSSSDQSATEASSPTLVSGAAATSVEKADDERADGGIDQDDDVELRELPAAVDEAADEEGTNGDINHYDIKSGGELLAEGKELKDERKGQSHDLKTLVGIVRAANIRAAKIRHLAKRRDALRHDLALQCAALAQNGIERLQEPYHLNRAQVHILLVWLESDFNFCKRNL